MHILCTLFFIKEIPILYFLFSGKVTLTDDPASIEETIPDFKSYHPVPGSPFTLFCCPLCNKTFNLKGNLKKHYLIHMGKRPFKCQYCSKQFRQKVTLKMHVLRIHNTPLQENPWISLVDIKLKIHDASLIFHWLIFETIVLRINNAHLQEIQEFHWLIFKTKFIN